MASKTELLQAQAFNRRRLQTAFTSGAPGGRELPPGKPLRGVVVSIALGILTIIVSLLIGTFTGSLPKDWSKGAIIVVRARDRATSPSARRCTRSGTWPAPAC